MQKQVSEWCFSNKRISTFDTEKSLPGVKSRLMYLYCQFPCRFQANHTFECITRHLSRYWSSLEFDQYTETVKVDDKLPMETDRETSHGYS